jgi:AcrR family transcriptional regulator
VQTNVKGTGAHRASLREEQALLTRHRILEAARRLLIGRGYGQVTMQDIAREAGVAYQTVFSQFGGKLNLALELCNAELAHVGGAIAIVAEARGREDPEAWLGMLGVFARRLYEPCAEVLRFMRESGDPELLTRLGEIEARRLELLADLGTQLEQSGRLGPGMTGEAAVDLAWTLTSPITYQQLVLDRGWTADHFEEWLSGALGDLILAR